ncbi:MAG: GntR family transcriptional regulator [Microthrixaceae bacterium]
MVQQPTLGERAYAELKTAILDGSLVSGAVLGEVELAEAMGISRTPVREALTMLRRDGLVDRRPGGSNVVHMLTGQEVRELFLLRDALESLSVRELVASDRRTEAVSQLQRILQDQRDALNRGAVSDFLDADELFHLTICHEAGLPQVSKMLTALRDKMRQAGLGAVARTERMPLVIEEHVAIVDAVRRGSRSEAAGAVSRHLTATRDAVERNAAQAPAGRKLAAEPSTSRSPLHTFTPPPQQDPEALDRPGSA